ncbi:Cna B-type domain-containing protein [Propionibacterium australiense]|uniref:Streptococcal pilin isopeptide linker n=1 Tax=Propionibacterium australiense TaxID=119981 RepID=A0A383SAC2_9ACTN|nr:Cna B-type domain-containing protein [Propionibacterium australiense]SYZ34502.1 Streptococcal pilin isopeptide linker [Propionibacterium australiense]VEH89833.1 Collagen adhesin precursor [Propionibacterium australiense]
MRRRLGRLAGILLLLVGLTTFGSVTTANADGSDAAAHFHATITTQNESIANGQYAAFTVSYTLDRGQINAGDYVTVTIPETLRNVSFAVSQQVFSGVEDLGGGQYRLIFNENAPNGISGSFSISAFGNNNSDSATTATVTVGDASKTITVGAGSHGGGVGPETRGIIKWGYEGDGYTQDTSSSGVYDQNRDVTVTYAIEVDPRMSVMTGVVVTDTLPAEMVLDPSSIRIVTEYPGDQTGPDLPADEVAQIVSISGNTMTFDFGDRLDGAKYYRIYYDATVPAGTMIKLTNNSSITYAGPNGPDVETSSFTLKPMSGYSSSLGYKSVDKTEISDDPEDQTVTYTITFENDQAFAVGEINLTDKLDSRVKYVDSYASSHFSLSYDEATNTVRITNIEAIPASSIQTVTIVTDFTEVPAGTTIENSVGGNTTKTTKVTGSLPLTATKTVDGEAPGDKVFSFDLLDAQGGVLQTARNAEDGTVSFAPISYGSEDIGVTHSYTVRESPDQETQGYTADTTVYTVTVTPTDEDGDGVLECDPVITKDGEPSGDMVFDNKLITTSVQVTKAWDDADDEDGLRPSSVTVHLYADDRDTGESLTLTAKDDWTGSFDGLPVYTDDGSPIAYSVTEDPVEGYETRPSGDATNGFTLTNVHTPTSSSSPTPEPSSPTPEPSSPTPEPSSPTPEPSSPTPEPSSPAASSPSDVPSSSSPEATDSSTAPAAESTTSGKRPGRLPKTGADSAGLAVGLLLVATAGGALALRRR